MSRDLIIIIGVIFLIYKLITHKGKLTLARIITFLGLAMGSGIALLHEFVPVFVLFFLSIVCMGISLVGMYFMIKNNEFESDKVEMYQSNFKAGVYAWLFLVALYIFLYVLTYY
ncbi:hypothetical protein [Veillonella caviae]|uniref:hypothetical protein n=1 Tax=Veillonella caviae TaxID=248316 RepID=UPI0023F4F3F6|nr:hypothetical protein [Veillonella caviae]MCI6408068.1 hypothetical protein [Veillonella caviae]MDY6225527.1 hypothetical protein [Veillonella caviae]